MTETNKFSVGSFVLLFAVLSIIACVGFLYKIQTGIVLQPHCIEVSADAETEVLADKAFWNIRFERTGSNQVNLNKSILEDKQVLQDFFTKHDIEKEDMEFSSFIHENYRSNKQEQPTYRAGYDLVIKSKDIEKILQLRDNLAELYEKGIILSHNSIDFQCSNSKDIQMQLSIKAATQAYEKAKNLATSLHTKIRKIHKVYDADFQVEGQGYMTKRVGVFNAMDSMNGSSNSQPVPKRKIKAFLRMEVEI